MPQAVDDLIIILKCQG